MMVFLLIVIELLMTVYKILLLYLTELLMTVYNIALS